MLVVPPFPVYHALPTVTPPTEAASTKPPLNAEQDRFVKVAMKGTNLYVTGAAGDYHGSFKTSPWVQADKFPPFWILSIEGSGKSFAISEFVRTARQHHSKIGSPAGAVVVLATTGMAVSVLDAGALTINSFLGTFNLSASNYHAAWERTRLSKDVLYNLSMLRVFVLDEGSCLSPLFWNLFGSNPHPLPRFQCLCFLSTVWDT